jgi:hypothetical protein
MIESTMNLLLIPQLLLLILAMATLAAMIWAGSRQS